MIMEVGRGLDWHAPVEWQERSEGQLPVEWH